MDFGGLISRFSAGLMPFQAILEHELRSLWTSWLVRLWLAATALLSLLLMGPNWGRLQTAHFLALLLLPYLVFPWFLVVMLLGISPVTGSRLESLADGILSRPVTRYEYLLASWAARVAVVLSVFLLVMVPATLLVALAKRPVPEDQVTVYGAVAAMGLVALVLMFLVSLGFLLGTLLRRSLLAAVVLIFTWLPVNFVLYTFSLEEFSPMSRSQALPTLLRTPWSAKDSADNDAVRLEDMQAVTEQFSRFVSVLSGGPQHPAKKPQGFFERGEYEDFSLTRVVLGYGLPTLLAVGLATLCFCRRDL